MLLLYLVIHQSITPLTCIVPKYTYICGYTWITSVFFSLQYIFVKYSLQVCGLCTYVFLNKLSFLVWYNFYHSERQKTIYSCSLNCSFHFILALCLSSSIFSLDEYYLSIVKTPFLKAALPAMPTFHFSSQIQSHFIVSVALLKFQLITGSPYRMNYY